MAVRTKKRPYWQCRRCSFRNLREHVNCRGTLPTGEPCPSQRPKKPVRAHRRILQGKTYPLFVQAAREIHGVTDESCCNLACGRQPSPERKMDRDHDHVTGKPRGLLCGGDTGCNVLLVRWITAPVARAIATAKAGRGELDAVRWDGLASYLERVEAFYAE
jgi:hypothetical protein